MKTRGRPSEVIGTIGNSGYLLRSTATFGKNGDPAAGGGAPRGKIAQTVAKLRDKIN